MARKEYEKVLDRPFIIRDGKKYELTDDEAWESFSYLLDINIADSLAPLLWRVGVTYSDPRVGNMLVGLLRNKTALYLTSTDYEDLLEGWMKEIIAKREVDCTEV